MEQIIEILNQGLTQPPLILEGKFNWNYWKNSVKPITQPFLEEIREQVCNLSKIPHKLFNIRQLQNKKKKQSYISSLQKADFKLQQPFHILVESEKRLLECFVYIGSELIVENELMQNSIVWGIQWWGDKILTAKICEVYRGIINDDDWAIANPEYRQLGKQAWCFKSKEATTLHTENRNHLTKTIARDLTNIYAEFLEKEQEFLKLKSRLGIA